MKRHLVVLVCVLAAVVVLLPVSAPAAPTATVAMSGLDNPRGLAFAPDGSLYVAEAGKGGTGQCLFLRGQNQCVGATGAISRLRDGVQERVVTGLPSYAPQPAGGGAIGPHDVAFRGDTGYATIGLAAESDPVAARLILGQGFGWVIRFKPDGRWAFFADIGSYESANNPDGGVKDSNPYGLLNRGGRLLMTDAGGNDLLGIAANAAISTVAVFPSRVNGRSTDAVPTAVTVGPDGAYYVSELTGFPFAPGAARVYRVVPGQAPQVYCSGFTDLIDLQFAPDGSLYVLEYATGPFLSGPGAILRVAPDCSRTTVYDALTHPTSLLLQTRHGEDDEDDEDQGGNRGNGVEAIYVSNLGDQALVGQVLRVQP